MTRPLVFLLIIGTLSLGSCSRPTRSEFLTKNIGSGCTVQFRRDALGAGATLPIPPTTSGINGAQVIVWGKLLSVEKDGIVIDSQEGTFWIPYHAVLSIKCEKSR